MKYRLPPEFPQPNSPISPHEIETMSSGRASKNFLYPGHESLIKLDKTVLTSSCSGYFPFSCISMNCLTKPFLSRKRRPYPVTPEICYNHPSHKI